MHPAAHRPAGRPDTACQPAFTTIEAIIAIVILTILTSIVAVGVTSNIDRSAAASIDTTLRQVELDAHALAQQHGQVDPAPWLHDAVVAVDLPQEEIDADLLRVTIDPAAGTVALTRNDRCRLLTVSTAGPPGTLTTCP